VEDWGTVNIEITVIDGVQRAAGLDRGWELTELIGLIRAGCEIWALVRSDFVRVVAVDFRDFKWSFGIPFKFLDSVRGGLRLVLDADGYEITNLKGDWAASGVDAFSVGCAAVVVEAFNNEAAGFALLGNAMKVTVNGGG